MVRDRNRVVTLRPAGFEPARTFTDYRGGTVRRRTRHKRLLQTLSGLAAVGLLAAGTTGARAEGTGEQNDAALIPVAVTGPDKVDLSLEGAPPPEGEPQIDLRLHAPGEAEADEDGVVHPLHQGQYRITIDATGLQDVADVQLPCDAEGLVAVCTANELYGGDQYNPHWGIRLDTSEASEAGDTGSIEVSGEGDGLEFTGHRIDVLVGGPEFRMRQLSEPEGLTAGEVYRAPLGFRNTGELPAHGAVLRVSGSRGLSFAEEHSNCEYAVENQDNLVRMRRVALCTFDGTFQAGTSYRLSTPMKVQTADFAHLDVLSYYFTALDPAEADRLQTGAYHSGDGPALTLERDPDTGSGSYVEHAELDFPHSSYDLDLTGDRVQGDAGGTVQAQVTLHNRGPAWFGALRSGGEPIGFTVEIPEGATATGVPGPCMPLGSAEDGPERYLCFGSTPLLEQDQRTFTFGLRIDRRIEGAKGRIYLPEWDNPSEGKPDNDDGWIVLNGTGDEQTPGDDGGQDGSGDTGGSGDSGGASEGDTGGSGSGDGSDDAGGGGSAGGQENGDENGGLALTGTSAWTLGGLALTALVAGAAAMVATRRRRTVGAHVENTGNTGNTGNAAPA